MTSVHGKVWQPQGWVAGRLEFEETIDGLHPDETPSQNFVVPGFIDVHVHGGGGADAMDGEEGVRRLARFHARHGTTTLLPTTITNPWPRIVAALHAIRTVRDRPQPGEASVLGAHLEGPFINPRKLGAQPPFDRLPETSLVEEVLTLEVLRVVTLAPEMPGALQAALLFAQAGVRVSLGHTLASAEQAAAVIGAVLEVGGSAGGTHLFNAMSGLSGREPGVVGALLASTDAYAELILDGHHVHLSSFHAALNAKPQRLLLVTDAMRAAGMPDGDYDLGGQLASVSAGQARLAGGTLAGSLLTLDEALRRAVQSGVELHRAVRLLSLHPAEYLGLADRGNLRAGSRADLLVLGEDLTVQQVYICGQRIA